MNVNISPLAVRTVLSIVMLVTSAAAMASQKLSTSHEPATQALLTNRLRYGNHSIGFRLVQAVDAGRSYLPARDYFGQPTRFQRGRPMQVGMWYPTTSQNTDRSFRYGDYLGFLASDSDFTRSSEVDRQFQEDAFLDSQQGPAVAAIRKLLNGNIPVALDAPIAAGDWPVVLYVPSLDSAFFDNSVLCEYLASKGYLVLSVTAKGEYTQLQSPTIRSVQVQVDDLAFLKQFAWQYSHSENVGTIGYSRGGLANILFAVKNKDVSATVSLDGSIFSEGWLRDAAASPYFVPSEIRSDLLMITKNLRDPQLNPATFYESAIHANRTLIRFDHDAHAYFSSWALLHDVAAGESESELDRYLDFYAEMTAYVGEFLDASLKAASPFKAHASQRFPHEYKPVTAIRSMDPAEISFWISESGIDSVNRAIEEILRSDGDYLSKISWRDLTAAAERALVDGNRGDALKILLLADRVVPGWYVVNEMIAVRHQESGDVERAKQRYARALLDHPLSVVSRRGLKDLGGSAPTASASVPISSYASYIGTYGEGNSNAKEIFLRNGELYIGSETWNSPARLLAYERERFLVESDDPAVNLQILFELDDRGEAKGLRTRGMNSGKIGEILLRKQERMPARR